MATYTGIVKDPIDALLLIEATRERILGRVLFRPSPKALVALVHSGAIFVFRRNESGIKRWTDRLKWTQSRVHSPYFFVYCEGTGTQNRGHSRGRRSQRPKKPKGELSPEELKIKELVGNLTVKPNGLVKMTFSIGMDEGHYMVVSYFTIDDFTSGRLSTPSSSPFFRNVRISRGLEDAFKKIAKTRPARRSLSRNPTPPLNESPHRPPTPPPYHDAPYQTHPPPSHDAPYQTHPPPSHDAYYQTHLPPFHDAPYQRHPPPLAVYATQPPDVIEQWLPVAGPSNSCHVEENLFDPPSCQSPVFSNPSWPFNMTAYCDELLAASENARLPMFNNIDGCSFEPFQYQVLQLSNSRTHPHFTGRDNPTFTIAPPPPPYNFLTFE